MAPSIKFQLSEGSRPRVFVTNLLSGLIGYRPSFKWEQSFFFPAIGNARFWSTSCPALMMGLRTLRALAQRVGVGGGTMCHSYSKLLCLSRDTPSTTKDVSYFLFSYLSCQLINLRACQEWKWAFLCTCRVLRLRTIIFWSVPSCRECHQLVRLEKLKVTRRASRSPILRINEDVTINSDAYKQHDSL